MLSLECVLCRADNKDSLVGVDRHVPDELTGASSSAFVLTNDWEASQSRPCSHATTLSGTNNTTSQLDATVADVCPTSVRNSKYSITMLLGILNETLDIQRLQ
jgi:hypothetical protein